MTIVGELFEDRLVHLVGKHRRPAVAGVHDDLDGLLLVECRVCEAFLNALHGIGEYVCAFRIKCKVVPFEVEQVYFMEEPLGFRYGLFLLFYGCWWL